MKKPNILINRENFNSHREAFIKILLVYSVIFILMQALFIWTFSSTIKNIKTEFWNQEEILFQKSVSIIDTDIKLMNAYCRDLAQSSSFYRLSQFKDSEATNFYYTAMKAKNSLSTNIYTAGTLPIKHFFAYFWNTDYVLSNNRFDSSNLFYNGIQSYPEEKQLLWEETIKNKETTTNLINVNDLLDSERDEFYYIVNMNKISYKKIPASVVFSIELDQIKENFTSLLLPNCEIIVIDENNNFLFNLNNGEDKFDEKDISNFIENAKSEIKADNQKYNIIKIKSSGLKWSFYLIQPTTLCEKQIIKYQTISYIVIFLSTFLGILLILYLISISMKPLLTLDIQLQTVQGDKDKLESFINDRTPILCKTYIRELMRGLIIHTDELKTARDFLNLNDPSLKYIVLYSIAYNNSNKTYNKNDFDNEVVNELYKEFSCNNRLYFFSPEERTYALLLPFTKDENIFREEIINKLKKVNNNLLINSSIWIYGGISNSCTKLKRIWTIYQQARTASQFVGSNEIFSNYFIRDIESTTYYYPIEIAEQLSYHISKNNIQQIKEIFILINQENFVNRNLKSDMVAFLLNDIKNTLIKCRLKINWIKDTESIDKLNLIDTKLQISLSIALLEHISNELCYFFENKNDETLIETIQNYIEENYNNPSICLTKIADEFLISESYVSHLFKNEKDINFSTFLENLRLNAAMKKLKCKDCKVSELYKHVGYNNATSFRRAFKKRYGVPPSSLRK